MVLQTYGLSINSDDECIENRLIDDNDEVIISDRKSVNYGDSMIAMSPFAGDYPPTTTNYINYTDLDASYATQGNNSLLVDESSSVQIQMIDCPLFVFDALQACTNTHILHHETLYDFNVTGSYQLFCNFCLFLDSNANSSSMEVDTVNEWKIFRFFYQKIISGVKIRSHNRRLFNYGFGENSKLQKTSSGNSICSQSEIEFSQFSPFFGSSPGDEST